MVCVLASSAVDRGFEPRSGQTKDYEINICCFSAIQLGHRSRQRFMRGGMSWPYLYGSWITTGVVSSNLDQGEMYSIM
jgi:hypothetical protein